MKQWFSFYGFATVTGGLWYALIGIIVAITFAFISGLAVRPNLTAFMIAGAISGLWTVFRPTKQREGVFQIQLFTIALIGLLLFSGLEPYAIGWDQGTLLQAVALLGAAYAQTRAILIVCRPMNLATWERRYFEQSLILSMKGFGFVIFTALVIMPFYILVMTSLKSQQALLANPLDLMPDFTTGPSEMFRSYIELFTDFNFGRYLGVSALVSVLTVIVTLLFAIPGAYTLARLRFPGRALLSRSILMIYLVPAIVLMIPLYVVFSKMGLRDTIFGLLIVYPATTLPVALYMLQGYFRGIPGELEEAGLMDGCSRMGVIWRITMPLSVPALASVGLYVFMIAWNEFLFAFMFLDDPNIFTLSRAMVSLNSSEVPRQHLMAGAVVSTVPILIIFLWAERFMVQGMTAGGVKG